MTYPSLPGRTVVRKLRGLLLAAVGIAAISLSASAAEAPKKSFDLPAADAAETLKAFTAQSGEQIIYPVENVRGVTTNAVKGEHAAREALDLMLAGTGLTIVQDAGTGALAVRRETDPNDPGATPNATARRQDPTEGEGEVKLVKLEAIQVLGTRIRQTEAMGPSPVSTYDSDYIRSTGALTLADFLNYLPQNYTGIGAGRGSAPNELNPEFGQRTESTTPLFDFVMGSSAAPPGQTGVSGVSLRGLGSGSTLVLVDGRRVAQSGGGNRSTTSQQGFVDLNTIPFGMIERIEVITDGASAIYGADAVAGVVNIVLKKDWVGNELSGAFKGAEHGGGRERQVSLTSGFAAGKLRGTVNVSYYDRASLKASQRAFSKNQNHTGVIAGYSATGTPVYGRDLTLLWGYPAVVQARTGNLNGVTYNGAPTRWATVNPGTTDGSSLASYTGAGAGQTGGASYIRRANTAEFLDIIPTSERYSFSGNFTYAVNNRLEAYGDYSYTDTRGVYNTQPAVSSASTSTGFGNFATIVPAAYNPFGQDVIVGLVHYEFGSIRQRTKTQAHRATAGIRGEFGQTWRWDTGVSRQWQDFAQITRTFNGARITAALNNADAAQRLNPFVDARVASTQNAAIYETMALYPTLNTESQLVTWDFDANGELFDIWGGPVRMAFGGSASRSKNESLAVNYSTAVTPVVSTSAVAGESDSRAAFAEVSVPLFGKSNALPGLQRLELQLASRYEDYDRAGDTTVPKIGVSWVPWQPVLFRASYSEGFRAPALTEYQVANTISNNNTLTDPRRTPASTTGITISRGASTFIEPETSESEFYGVVIEPPGAKGLTLHVDYYRTTQENVIQQLSGQTVVNNEALFPSRVTRAPADATDIALGQPGRITAVDLTFINFGEVRNESIDYGVDYLLPWEQLGRWRVTVSSSNTLTSTRQLAPGQPPIVDDDDTFAPPKWKHNASVFWNNGSWNASVFFTYISSFKSNAAGNTLTATYPVPSVYKVDLRGGYEFKQGVWRGYGKNLRIQAGIGNVFDKEPPFSDTVFGYNGGLHGSYAMGRTYEFSFVQPF